jgi:hypothetical protein
MTRYEALVDGVLWQGGKGYTSYSFGNKPTRAQVIAKCGDFQEVTRIRLHRIVTTQTNDVPFAVDTEDAIEQARR